MSARLSIAHKAWGSGMPDWVRVLVVACDAPGASQSNVARRLGISGSVISTVLRKAYKGDMARIEARVRAVYIETDVACPALGNIKSESCLKWRDQAGTLNSSSPLVVRMYRACRACPRSPDRPDHG